MYCKQYMQKQISKGVIKGGINTFEFFLGVVTGIMMNKMYKKYYYENKTNNTPRKVYTITVYIFILCSICFIIRELMKLVFKKTIMSKMNYEQFTWPEPIMFGFGMLFFQDILKEQVKDIFEK